jgi:PrtD family type I secretion system ABC transporter
MQAASQRGKNEVGTLIRQNRAVFVAIFFFSAIVNILMLTGPLFMLQIYDRVIPAGSIPTLVALAFIVLVLYSYYGVLEYIRTRLLVRVGRRLEEKLRARVFDAVAASALSKQGTIGSQPVHDLTTIRQYLAGQGPLAFLDMPWVPIYLLVCALMHWVLGIVALVSAIIIFALALATERATRHPTAQATAAASRASMMTDEARRNSEALHSLGMKGVMRQRWVNVHTEALDFQTNANDASAIFSSISRVFRLAVQSGMLAAAAYLAVKHEITGGTIVASSILMGRALAPVEQAVASWQQFLGARKAYERLGKILEMVPVEPERMKLPPPKGLLEVENLAVSLPGTEKPVLQGVSFKVEPGKGLGVIGPTGAGKSTLARVLVGLIAAGRGAVRLDGATPEQRSVDERGSLIGYLPQDVQIFDGTVAQNISRFAEDADAVDIVEAAKLANIHDFIMRLPQGYDTQLNEGGARLSAGQRQRVALARALFGDPVLMVLDEPNSNLDSEGELALDGAIRACLNRGAAVVVVAHRPSALNAMSDLLVLAAGQVAIYGSREEVMKKVAPRPQPPSTPVLAAVPTPIRN